MSDNRIKNNNSDEIDLLDLFNRMFSSIGRGLKALGNGLIHAIVFMLRRWVWLGLSVVAGVGASYLLKAISDPFFESDMTLRSNVIYSSEMISYINSLHDYCEEDNIFALSEALSLESGSVDNIIDMNAFWVIDIGKDGIPDNVDYNNNHDIYDTINVRMQDRVSIRVKIKSPDELSLIGNGIITFIEKDSLFQQRNRIRLRQNLELLARLDYDIMQLDSLQGVKYFEETRNRQPLTGGQMIFLQEQKTQLLYPDIYALYYRKQALESERDLYNEIVTVLSEFSIPLKRDNGGMYYGKFVIPCFFIFTLLILIMLTHREKLKEIYNKY